MSSLHVKIDIATSIVLCVLLISSGMVSILFFGGDVLRAAEHVLPTGYRRARGGVARKVAPIFARGGTKLLYPSRPSLALAVRQPHPTTYRLAHSLRMKSCSRFVLQYNNLRSPDSFLDYPGIVAASSAVERTEKHARYIAAARLPRCGSFIPCRNPTLWLGVCRRANTSQAFTRAGDWMLPSP